jgi:hypothetical protein
VKPMLMEPHRLEEIRSALEAVGRHPSATWGTAIVHDLMAHVTALEAELAVVRPVAEAAHELDKYEDWDQNYGPDEVMRAPDDPSAWSDARRALSESVNLYVIHTRRTE